MADDNLVKEIDIDDARPDPDTLLDAIQTQANYHKGKLKIFLGATPGVGKTFAMLEAAHAAQANDINVVVGVIETHGRNDTEKLLDNLALFPTKKIEYRGKIFDEVDTERLITEKPQLVLVDELAHRNITGSINNKRYQDILNLLEAGIDVYTTVNVQHLESLNDEIYQITKVKVKETVPDYIFEIANETVVIDITPDELIERLQQGKVYVPHEASRALNNYFSKNNISALRALAMRVAAKSISNRVISYKQTHGINEPWVVREKTLVCLSDSSFTPSLIRSAKRIASKNDAELVAIYIDTPLRTPSLQGKKRLTNYKRYAEYLGAKVVTLTSVNVSKCILKYANENNINHIVLSKAVHSKLAEFLIGSVVYDVIRHSGNINVHVLSERPKAERSSLPKLLINKFFYMRSNKKKYYHLAIDLAILIFVAAVSYLLKTHGFIDNISVMFLFIIGVVFSAYKHGYFASMSVSVASCLIYTVFFVEPIFKFKIYDETGIVALVIFFLVSYTISRLTYVLQEQLKRSTDREKVVTTLYDYSRKMVEFSSLEKIYVESAKSFYAILDTQTVLYVSDQNDNLSFVSSYPEISSLKVKADVALEWTWKNGQVSGAGTDTLSSSEWFFSPIKLENRKIGVIGVNIGSDKSLFDPQIYEVFQSLIDLTAVAVDRLSQQNNRE